MFDNYTKATPTQKSYIFLYRHAYSKFANDILRSFYGFNLQNNLF